jgi:hypothetical protein
MKVKYNAWIDLSKAARETNLIVGADLRGIDFSHADMSWAALHCANLQGVDMQVANLRYADLRGAALQGSFLQGSNLHYANLRYADLRGANLRHSDLHGADMQGANMQGANIDFSAWPMWCGSKNVTVDVKIARQLAAHFCAVICDDPEYSEARAAILEFAKKSHHAKDIGIG